MSKYALYNKYPRMAEAADREQLGSWPTPLQPLEKLSAYLGGKKVLIKRDDLSSPLYGGNKVRKLEFILAEARKRGCREIITAGGLGSNHVLATAALGGQAGFHVVALLFCQPVTERVKKSLLLDHALGTEMHFVRDYPGLALGYLRFYLARKLAGKKPLLLMPGGSNSLTTMGYINCIMEIEEQNKEMAYPEPEAIFTAAGTGGTAAGLLAGIALNGWSTRLHAVRVVNPAILNSSRITGLAAATLTCLAKKDTGFVKIPEKALNRNLSLEDQYLGEGYGFASEKTGEAVKIFRDLEGIELEECYTAKAAAALLDYCRKGGDKKPVIFIYTANSSDLAATHKLPDPLQLPSAFHWCFNDEAQNCRCGLLKQNYSFCTVVRRPGWRWPL